MDRCILHVDIDAFFASVEQIRNPALRGKPVIVGSGVIASCSYEAREYGLYAGMPLRKAKKLCPQAEVLEGHYPTYRCFSRRVFECCREFAPHVEELLDEAYCDITGTEALHGPPLEIGRSLRESVRDRTGLAVSVGIGSNRMIAKMAGSSQKPDGLVKVEKGSEAGFIRDLPIADLPGVGRSRLKVLRKLNIQTIGDLRALDRQSLQTLFGADGLALYERCRGRDSRALNESEIPQSISRETSFHEPTSDTTEIEGMLYYLLERASRAMRKLGLKCGTLGVHIRYSDSGSQQSSRTLPAATSLDKELFETARERLWKLYTRRASLHSLGVRLSNFSAAGQLQGQLFDRQEPDKLARLYSCLDQLRQKFGHSVIMAGKSFEAGKKLSGDRYGYRLRTPSLTK